MPDSIENQLEQLPQFAPPVAFKDDLQKQLTANTVSAPRKNFRWLLALGCMAIAVGIAYWRLQPSQVKPVAAAEIIQTFMQTYLKPSSIMHRAYWLFEGRKEDYRQNTGIYRELWDDQVCGMFYQKIVEPGQPTNIQGSDMQATYHINESDHTVTLFPGDRSNNCQEGQTIEVDLAARLNELLADQTLLATPGLFNGQQVYFIHDNRASDDKLWDTYIFNYETKKLVATYKEQDGFYVHMDYLFFETLERNNETLVMFSYPPKDINLANYTVSKQITDPKTGNYEMEIISQPTDANPSPSPETMRVWDSFSNDVFSMKYPAGLRVDVPEKYNDTPYAVQLVDSSKIIHVFYILSDKEVGAVAEDKLKESEVEYSWLSGKMSNYPALMAVLPRFPEGRYVAFIKNPANNRILHIPMSNVSLDEAERIVESVTFN